MSAKPSIERPINHKNNGIFSELTKSLLSRQLLSSFIITILGLSILSGLYYYTQKKSYMEKAHINAKALDDDMLGLISYSKDTGRFYVEPDNYILVEKKLKSYRLTTENDDRFAYIINRDSNEIVWHSQSFKDVNYTNIDKAPYPKAYLDALPLLNPIKKIENGAHTLDVLPANNTIKIKEGRNLGNSNYLVYYSAFSEKPRNFYMVIALSSREMERKKSEILQKISILILITSTLVLLAQFVNSYLVITPIKRFENEIKDIESGEQEFIKGHYPTELFEVKGAINALVQVEKGQKKRYREALDNLAHSLKTPLAVLQGAAENSDSMAEQQRSLLINQVTRMNDIIAYQLRRAVVNDHSVNIKRNEIRPILYRLKNTLVKVHHDKFFEIEVNVDEHTACRLSKDDLMEVFGNLINNACRFCEKIVSVTATHNGDTVIIDIDDDGLGFPDKNPSTLLKRGMRADNKTDGQGIGLAISNEIIETAGGQIELLVSPYVGARVRLHLPL